MKHLGILTLLAWAPFLSWGLNQELPLQLQFTCTAPAGVAAPLVAILNSQRGNSTSLQINKNGSSRSFDLDLVYTDESGSYFEAESFSENIAVTIAANKKTASVSLTNPQVLYRCVAARPAPPHSRN